jgi:hypothetical protein
MSSTKTKTEKAKKQSKNSGRDARGRFAKGNAGGPGNPFARQVGLIRAVMVETFRPEHMARTVIALTEKAVAGDVPAAKLLFTFILGKPAEMVDPDRLAIDEWQKLKETAVESREAAAVLEKYPATVACELVKMEWPAELERNLREGAEERALVEAEVAEDERYKAELEAAEAEALRQKEEALKQKPAAVSPETVREIMRSRQVYPAAAEPVAPQGKSPSTNRVNGSSPPEEFESPSERGTSLISGLTQRLNQRLSSGGAAALLDLPSTNGEKTDVDADS